MRLGNEVKLSNRIPQEAEPEAEFFPTLQKSHELDLEEPENLPYVKVGRAQEYPPFELPSDGYFSTFFKSIL